MLLTRSNSKCFILVWYGVFRQTDGNTVSDAVPCNPEPLPVRDVQVRLMKRRLKIRDFQGYCGRTIVSECS